MSNLSGEKERGTHKDPTGHYASAYNRILNNSRDQEQEDNFINVEPVHRNARASGQYEDSGDVNNDSHRIAIRDNVGRSNNNNAPSTYQNLRLTTNNPSVKRRRIRFQNDYDEDEDDSQSSASYNPLFVSDDASYSPGYLPRSRESGHLVYSRENNQIVRQGENQNFHDGQQQAQYTADEIRYFNNTGRNLPPSRYSGAEMPWGLNQTPKMTPQEQVSDAALLKRNLKRGQGDKVCKRGYGANDPENIAIVNLKENDGLTFEQIASQLNEERLQTGRDPTLSVCAVNARYNRTAPLLYAAQGKEFVPLNQRRAARIKARTVIKVPLWNDELDIQLVNCVKEVEAQKWFLVAQKFAQKTGKPMDAKSAAIRHSIL